jgi:hypothetical protein
MTVITHGGKMENRFSYHKNEQTCLATTRIHDRWQAVAA